MRFPRHWKGANIMPAASSSVRQHQERSLPDSMITPLRRRAALFLVSALLLSMCLGALGDAASVMDKDGDGKVSTEEFVQHAAEQQKEDSCAADGSCKPKEQADEPKATLREQQDSQTPEQMEAEAAAAQAQLLEAKKELQQAVKSGVPVEMSSANAAAILDGTSNIFIKFSTSWCGHCVKMAPDWKKLAKDIHSDYKGCLVVSVDCEKEAQLCQAFSVQGYPTIMLLKTTKTPEGEVAYEPVKYEQARERGAMLGFLRDKKAAQAKNWIMATVKQLLGSVFNIQVQMPK